LDFSLFATILDQAVLVDQDLDSSEQIRNASCPDMHSAIRIFRRFASSAVAFRAPKTKVSVSNLIKLTAKLSALSRSVEGGVNLKVQIPGFASVFTVSNGT
jgi:hypothetical protein